MDDWRFVNDWRIKINGLIAVYQLGNTANCDETGLIFCTLANTTQKIIGERCVGRK